MPCSPHCSIVVHLGPEKRLWNSEWQNPGLTHLWSHPESHAPCRHRVRPKKTYCIELPPRPTLFIPRVVKLPISLKYMLCSTVWNHLDHVSIILDTSTLRTHTHTLTHTSSFEHCKTTLLAVIYHSLARLTPLKMKAQLATVWWERPRLTEGAVKSTSIGH